MPDSPQKAMRNLRRRGFTVTVTNSGHFKITRPPHKGFVIGSATASDRKGWLNLQKHLRKTFPDA